MVAQSQEGRIILAIQAIQSTENLSRRKAVALYNVPGSTLHDRINGKPPKRELRTAAPLMTLSREEVIIQHVLDLDA